MNKIILSFGLLFLICLPESGKSFQFDHWKSGMSLAELIEIAQKQNLVLYRTNSALSQQGLDLIVRPFVNRRIDPNHLDDVDHAYYGTNLLKKWAVVSLMFTPTSKRLASIIVKWTESSAEKIDSFRFDPDFVNGIKKTLEKKYGPSTEIEDPDDDEKALFKTYACYWQIGGADTILLNTDYQSLRIVYSNSTIVQLAEKEKAMMEQEKAVREKEKHVEDLEKF